MSARRTEAAFRSDPLDGWEMSEVPELGLIAARRGPSGGLAVLLLGERARRLRQRAVRPTELREDLKQGLERYLEGDPNAFEQMVLEPAATVFARSVREALLQIPRGSVATYGQIAIRVGKPKAARAVGGACKSNPIPLVVPCHRVVSATGWGGYALGLGWKSTLLKLEGFDLETLPNRLSFATAAH